MPRLQKRISRNVDILPSAMIQQLFSFPSDVVAVSCIGRITELEYQTVLVPAIAAALRAHRKLRLYYETGPFFRVEGEGDLKLGLEHLTHWERVALVTDIEWMRWTARALSFLLPGDVRAFLSSETAQARAWVSERPAS